MSLNKKIILTSVILAAIFLMSIFLIIYPLFNQIKRNSQQLLNQRGEIFLFENKIENLKYFEKAYQIYQQDLEKINLLFINSENPRHIIKLVDFLREIARASQISIEISSPTPKRETDIDPWPFITFYVSSKGEFTNFSRFFEKLELSSYLIEIENLDISRLEKDTGFALLIKVFVK